MRGKDTSLTVADASRLSKVALFTQMATYQARQGALFSQGYLA